MKCRATGVGAAFELPCRVPATVRSDLMVVGCQPRRCGRSCEEVGRAQADFFRIIIVGKWVFDVRVLGLMLFWREDRGHENRREGFGPFFLREVL